MGSYVRPMRVATFNVHHCAGRDGVVDMEKTVAAIKATGAELVALQELDRFMDRSGRIDQPDELARRLDMEVAFFPTLRRGDGEYGIAIAAPRGTLSEAHYVPLPRVDIEEPRGAITAEWNGTGIVCTHLSTAPGPLRIQTGALAAIANGMDGPVAVLGDLNQGARTLTPFTRFGYRGAFGHGTLPRRFPRRQIDHILVGRGLEIERSWTIPSTASDHLPLVADLSLRLP